MEHSLEISEKEEQQKKHYLLQSELQNMARELPACVLSNLFSHRSKRRIRLGPFHSDQKRLRTQGEVSFNVLPIVVFSTCEHS